MGPKRRAPRDATKSPKERGHQGAPVRSTRRLPKRFKVEPHKRQTQQAPKSSQRRQPRRLHEKTTEDLQPKRLESGTSPKCKLPKGPTKKPIRKCNPRGPSEGPEKYPKRLRNNAKRGPERLKEAAPKMHSILPRRLPHYHGHSHI